jgi:sugar O-acyltransferase (sialic acid O-acetyltransferase NeuD family)
MTASKQEETPFPESEILSPYHSTIFILGSGGFAKELRAYYQTTFVHPVKVILVDDNGGNISMSEYYKYALADSSSSIMGSGKCDIKQKMINQIKGRIDTFIHPRAIIIEANIGEGSVIAPNSVIAPFAKIGRHVLVNYSSTIGHETIVGDLSVIGPQAAIGGNCLIKENVYIGAGALIKEGTTIGSNCVIGIGAVVLNDIQPDNIVIGNPGRAFHHVIWNKHIAKQISESERQAVKNLFMVARIESGKCVRCNNIVLDGLTVCEKCMPA